MGLYDRFYVKAKCPRCGKEEILEFQTKAFDPALRTWKEGEAFIHPEVLIIEGKIMGCIAIHDECPNPKIINKLDGYTERYTPFYGNIIIKDGKVVGVENIQEAD